MRRKNLCGRNRGNMSNNTIHDVKLLLLTLLSLLIFFTAMPQDVSATAGWWNSSWNQRINITIDYTKVNSTQTNFPVLINISDSNLTKAQTNGNDIVFINSTDNIKLDHEIEHFNSTTGWLVAWVRIPTLSNTTNTTLGMYYNYSAASNQQNPQAVWDDDYVMVQHLQETDIDSGSGDIKDSTSNNNDGTTSGMDTTDQVAGQVDGSFDFDGGNEYIAATGYDITNFTLCAWVKPSTITNYKGIVDFSTSVGFRRGIGFDTAGSPCVVYGSQKYKTSTSGDIDDNAWHYVVGIYNGTEAQLYVDGTSVSLGSELGVGNPTENGVLRIADFTIYGYYLNGTIDEIRISNTTRSAGWIKTSYNNQYSPSTFYTHTDEETYTEDSTPYLEVNLITPFDNTIVSQNKTFVVNATVYCRAADCGNVNGTVRYNKTSQTPDEPVSDITGDTPFYIISNINTINCTSNPLTEDEYCNLSWTLNATGALSERYELDVFLESNATSSNNTDDSTLKIDLALIIGLEFTEINFGILDPGSVNQPADNNANGYNVSVDINSDDVENLWVRGTNLTNDNSDTLDCTIHDQYNQYEGNTTNHPCMIDVGNIMWSLESNPAPANKYNLTGTYERVNKDYHTIYAGDYETTYYWINVPYGIYAGPYTGTITFMANATW